MYVPDAPAIGAPPAVKVSQTMIEGKPEKPYEPPLDGMAVVRSDTGILRSKITYRDGQLDGEAQNFTNDGKLYRKATYRAGVCLHAEGFDTATGERTDETEYDRNGNPTLTKYFEHGVVRRKLHYENGIGKYEETFGDSGEITVKTTFSGNSLITEYFNPGGTIKRRENHTSNYKNGLFTYYGANGKPEKEELYKYNTLISVTAIDEKGRRSTTNLVNPKDVGDPYTFVAPVKKSLPPPDLTPQQETTRSGQNNTEVKPPSGIPSNALR
ncbi:MAG: hypothetical protein WCS77_07410 [Elusimicrobiaceae bacterium]